MQRTQIYLSEAERQGLRALAQRSGRSQSALIREAIDSFLERHLWSVISPRAVWPASARPVASGQAAMTCLRGRNCAGN